MGAVLISADCATTLLAHALSSEREEVLALLLGRWVGESAEGPSAVRIVTTVAFPRHDHTSTRVEFDAESVGQAAGELDRLVRATGDTTLRIVGWFHSHPHITAEPSHVDLETQGNWQGLAPGWIGLIASVFTQGSAPGSRRTWLTAFQAERDTSSPHGWARREVPLWITPAPIPAPMDSRPTSVDLDLDTALAPLQMLACPLSPRSEWALQDALLGQLHLRSLSLREAARVRLPSLPLAPAPPTTPHETTANATATVSVRSATHGPDHSATSAPSEMRGGESTSLSRVGSGPLLLPATWHHHHDDATSLSGASSDAMLIQFLDECAGLHGTGKHPSDGYRRTLARAGLSDVWGVIEACSSLMIHGVRLRADVESLSLGCHLTDPKAGSRMASRRSVDEARGMSSLQSHDGATSDTPAARVAWHPGPAVSDAPSARVEWHPVPAASDIAWTGWVPANGFGASATARASSDDKRLPLDSGSASSDPASKQEAPALPAPSDRSGPSSGAAAAAAAASGGTARDGDDTIMRRHLPEVVAQAFPALPSTAQAQLRAAYHALDSISSTDPSVYFRYTRPTVTLIRKTMMGLRTSVSRAALVIEVSSSDSLGGSPTESDPRFWLFLAPLTTAEAVLPPKSAWESLGVISDVRDATWELISKRRVPRHALVSEAAPWFVVLRTEWAEVTIHTQDAQLYLRLLLWLAPLVCIAMSASE